MSENNMWEIEDSYYEKGLRLICGVDEAGRGPLAGPVFAAAVILPENYSHEILNDSKKLSEKKRDLVYDDIIRDAISWSVGIADEKEIMKVYGALAKYFPSWVGYNMAKCGGCIRACVSMLERRGGCMENRFEKPLRKGKPWKLDR